MNLILLLPDDFISDRLARLSGRRFAHISAVHRVQVGDTVNVGLLGGSMGRAVVTGLTPESVDLEVALDQPPPPKLPLTLILALPRPKVLNRVVAAATSLGVR